jgi:cytochrome c biogenesis protein CcmG/thiol:disulfide interchange protein DsbE
MLALGMGPGTAGQTSVPKMSRNIAPSFSLRDVKGARVRLSDYRGKVVLLDFWATWCTGCKVEIPWYIEFENRYRRQGLVSIGVAMDEEGWQAVTPYLKTHPINYRIVLADAIVSQNYRITSLPLTLLIDRKGNIAESFAGVVDKSAWQARIRELLQESPK